LCLFSFFFLNKNMSSYVSVYVYFMTIYLCSSSDFPLGPHFFLKKKQVKGRQGFFEQAQEEIAILAMLNRRDPTGAAGVVQLLHTFVHAGHQALVFELLSLNLYVKRQVVYIYIYLGCMMNFFFFFFNT
jgi:hypothetical protein